jgi:hypothetical protein
MNWERIISFLGKAFSDEHGPSSSRITSAWLSVSSMALIWWMVKHMMSQSLEKLQVWVGGLPLIIGALATFAASPYGIMKFTEMFKKAGDKIAEVEEKQQ